MKQNLVIAIDGYVATGKGTTALWLAQKLGYIYLDTGAMYRAVTRYALTHDLLDADEQTKTQMMGQIEISFQLNPTTNHHDTYLNGENIESYIRKPELSLRMKPIVTSPAIRTALGQLQSDMGTQGGIVADGRDMGTVIFPHADVKIFLVCDTHIRAQRRYEQLTQRWDIVNIDDIYKDISQRDDTDYLGPQAINKKADDAIQIDTSHLTIEAQIDQIYNLITQL